MSKELVIYFSPNLDLAPFHSAFEKEDISLRELNLTNTEGLKSNESLKIILIDDEYFNSMIKGMSEKVFTPNNNNTIILIQGKHKQETVKHLEEEKIFIYLNFPINRNELLKAIKSGFLFLHSRAECESLRSEINLRTSELTDLKKIGSELSIEYDYGKLLSTILSKSREITNCDAGSIFIIEKDKSGAGILIFKLVQNDSLAYHDFQESILPIDNKSIAGYVALTGKFLNLEDVYNIGDNEGFKFNIDFDKKYNYRTKSMLVIPMRDHSKKIIGILQLINRKKSLNVQLTSEAIVDSEVLPFDEKTIEIINSLADKSAESIKDNIWSHTVQKIFELSDLNKIGIALSAEQDFDKLLNLILSNSKAITNCDAASLYLLDETKGNEDNLIFKLVQNDSLTDLSFREHTLPITKTSIAGYVALTGEFVNLEDAYNIPEDADYTFNVDFDKTFKYRTKSILAIPMRGHRNKIVGVLELINRKKNLDIKLTSEKIVQDNVVPFGKKSIELINIVANQAAISIENNVWSQAIQKIFELSDLNKIGIALSAEQDYDKLLNLILSKSREIANCDAGSLYLIEETKEGEKKLIFKLVQNDTLTNIPFRESTLPITKTSIAGYVAMTGEFINLEDVYNIQEVAEYTYYKDFDKKYNYRNKSMLVIPMTDHKNKVIGVVQLINRKRSRNIKLTSESIVETEVIPFDERSIEILNSLASQAAVAIENNILHQNIQKLFEGFVKASVHAIEQRDPSTFGHSERVATMTVGLAELVNKSATPRFRNTSFSKDHIKEIRYAGLLHDFGKVGVREHVLVKAKKLYPENLRLIKGRFDFIKKSIECKYLKEKINLMRCKDLDNYERRLSEIDKELLEKKMAIDNYLEDILIGNEPSILQEDICKEIMQIAENTYTDYNERVHPYLTPEELNYLSIKKGSLDENERLEIESHVSSSYEFLKKIPWTKELDRIPDIAHAHHEKLNGAGYPLKLGKKDIPLQSKMMAIADIYDALTAQDRPYKKAVPRDRALDIIGSEVKGSLLDTDIYNLFLDGKVYELV